MARRAEDVVPYRAREADDGGWQPPPEMRARMMAEVEAYRRGELKTVSWDELEPIVDAWIAECEEAGGDGEETED